MTFTIAATTNLSIDSSITCYANQIYPWEINPVIENHDLILMHVIVSGIMWVDHIDSVITT